MVHRITSIREKDGQRVFTTRGDANRTGDVAEITLPQTAWRVWYDVPAAGYVISFATSRAGILLMILVPAAGLALYSGADWLKRILGGRRLSYSS